MKNLIFYKQLHKGQKMADEKSKLDLQLTQEQIEYLLKKTGATDAGTEDSKNALISTINLDLIKMHLASLVPTLSDKHKEELKSFLIKKFQLDKSHPTE